MKVVCTEIDPDRFQIGDDHKNHFKGLFGRGAQPKTFHDLQIGEEYTVYACRIARGYPSYYVACGRSPGPWSFRPSLCFEVVDPRASKLWHFATRVYRSRAGEEWFYSILAIEQWIKERQFFERLVDGNERERSIMTIAAADMDAEFA